MANYKKSFNFRNGVQVDEDNFVVNANGLVGIGTTIPEGYLLNVYGDTRVTGVVTANQLNVGVATVGFLTATGASVSGVVTAASFSGSAAGLTGIYAVAVDGWYISGGTISTTSNVGIGTTLPTGNFQVGVAVTINTTGDATYTGIVTAAGFTGSGTSITSINADNISSGTLSNTRLPSNINVSGIVTASSFVGVGSDLTLLNASNIASGTLSNDRLPSNINVSGVVTATSLVGSGIGITQINASNIESGTLSNSRLPSDINVLGVVTATTFVGNLTGTATTATSLSGSPNIVVGIATATNSLGVGNNGTGFSALSSARIGVGTAIPTSELQIIKSNDTLVEVISQTNQSRISIGQSVGVGKSTGILRFGNTNNTFDIINNDTGNINMYLHNGPAGVGTGRFDWLYGQTNIRLMSLTYGGRLGIGITNPNETLHVVGTSTVTGNAWFGGNLVVNGDLSVGSLSLPAFTGTLLGNVYTTTGISTFNNLTTLGNITVSAASSIGIGTAVPRVDLDARDKRGLFGSIGIFTDVFYGTEVVALGGNVVSPSGGVGIGTTAVNPFGGGVQVYGQAVELYNATLNIKPTSVIAFNSNNSRAIFDYGSVGSATTRPVMVVPNIDNSTRNGIGQTPAGSMIFNTDTLKFQGYTGVGWTDFH